MCGLSAEERSVYTLRWIFWLGLLVIGLAEILVHQMDYSVPLTANLALFTSPNAPGEFVISHTVAGRVVSDVREYCVLKDGGVVGRSGVEYFVVDRLGAAKFFTEERLWLAAISPMEVHLTYPRRADDPRYWQVQVILIAVGAMLLVGAVCFCAIRRARMRGSGRAELRVQ